MVWIENVLVGDEKRHVIRNAVQGRLVGTGVLLGMRIGKELT